MTNTIDTNIFAENPDEIEAANLDLSSWSFVLRFGCAKVFLSRAAAEAVVRALEIELRLESATETIEALEADSDTEWLCDRCGNPSDDPLVSCPCDYYLTACTMHVCAACASEIAANTP
jgi:hypothetical protein